MDDELLPLRPVALDEDVGDPVGMSDAGTAEMGAGDWPPSWGGQNVNL